MNPSLYLLYHRIFSFFLRTATVYVEPLLHPWNKPNHKKLIDPISAADLLHYWPGLCENDLALLIEQELKRVQEPTIFARPYLRLPNTRIACTAGGSFEEDVYPPKTPFPHVTYKNGHKLFDFSRILFDREELAPFAVRFRFADELLASRETANSTLKNGDSKIAAELAKLRKDLGKRDSQVLVKYLPVAQKIFEQEFHKFPVNKMEYKKEENEFSPVKIKSGEFLEKMKSAAPDLPQSTCLEFWKLLSPIYKLSGRECDPE